MQFFKVASLKAWQALAAGEVIEFTQGEKNTTVKIDFIADGPCAIFSQTREQGEKSEQTLIAYVEGGQFQVEVKTGEDFAIRPEMVDGVTLQYKTDRRDQLVNKSAEKVHTEVAPKRRQNDSMFQMQQMMRWNDMHREKQFERMLDQQEKRFAKQLEKRDLNGDGVIDDAEKQAAKKAKEAKAKADEAEAKAKADAEAKAKEEAAANET